MEVENHLFVVENGLPKGPFSTSMLVSQSVDESNLVYVKAA